MILNELLTKQNVLTKVILKDGDKELPRELKVKLMRIRMHYNKVKQNFDNEVREFVSELLTDEFKYLNNVKNRTEEEEQRFLFLSDEIDSEYQEFLKQKGYESVSPIDDSFTEDEYFEIVEVNAGNNVEINDKLITAPDFLEILYNLFVK